MSRLRCAIYTRKSTEDGLEQDFNSLHAQREACEAYIISQKSEGWVLLPEAYDDGGFSGGTLERPGLKALLADVEAGKIDIVLVYKVDRLTRSLMDFAQIVQRLDRKAVSFVSVTQAFNTTTSMGRLTLNVLLSFAQFEREVTAERIRDKIAASKKKGLWMGGVVPLGYDLQERQLVIDDADAEIVRWLYASYLELGSVRHLKEAAEQRGFRSRGRDPAQARRPFSRGQLYTLLKNPIYRGKIHHQGQLYDGQHQAIIKQELWDKVQSQFAHNYGVRTEARNRPTSSWLTRLLRDSQNEPMIASHSSKAGCRYRYYVSESLMGKKTPMDQGWRLPARAMEALVVQGIQTLLRDPVALTRHLGIVPMTAEIFLAVTQGVKGIPTANPDGLRPLIHQVQVSLHEVRIEIDGLVLYQALNCPVGDQAMLANPVVTLPVQLKRRGVEMRVVIPGQKRENVPRDENLVRLIAKAHLWGEQLRTGQRQTIKDIAASEKMDLGDVSRRLPLAFLAPDIVATILDGEQPVDLMPRKLTRLTDLPLDWPSQRALLGFPAVH
ncbi:recombinase family protein [Govanella unica]|uniref:Recombinase family protein n=1 Tax=Govanella unica TaxID=2975056 RepID=A0A9X3U0G2_9PROT|nr:recombinase family protein [Govania unica]MDA5194982.1 recombinase family protein [Govania unica]